MKILSLLLIILLSGCATTPVHQTDQKIQNHKNCGFRIGISQYSSTGLYFDYNCNTYQGS